MNPTTRTTQKIERVPGSLTEVIPALVKITAKMKLLGMLVVAATVANFAASFVFPLRQEHSLSAQDFAMGLGATICGLLGSILFESARKEGDVMFKEVSDELQWYVRFDPEPKSTTAPDERPKLESRLALRSFAQTTDLPLIPGTYGPLFYAVLNILIVLGSALLFGLRRT